MRLLSVGLSHHSAPVEVRERFAVSGDGVRALLADARQDGLAREALVVSTCNRVELYVIPEEGIDQQRLAAWFAQRSGLGVREALPHMLRFEDSEALRHLVRVASSLDSMIVGEPQILGQIKEAYRLSVEAEGTGPLLRRVMDRALGLAKRMRTETAISREAVSMGRAGVELARQVLGHLDGRAALLVGAGEHGRLVARSLLSYGLSDIVVANRTFARAAELAEEFGGTASHLDRLEQHLARVDVVITSTGAGRVLISRDMLAPILRRRRLRSMVLIDLSVPRNIGTDVNDVGGVYRFDVDDLAEVARQGAEKRQAAAAEAETLVSEQCALLWRRLRGESTQLRIGAVTRRAEEIRQAELARAEGVLGRLEPKDRAAVEAMTRAIVKKVLHQPLASARKLAEAGDVERFTSLLEALGAAPPESPKE